MLKENLSGTFEEDLKFLQTHGDVVVLKNKSEQAQVVVSPQLQGKVMTSTAGGLKGKSFGWINYDLISSGKNAEHINAYGGEDRLWLGPEGGQFSIFFPPGTEMTLKNWFTPKGIDTEPFNLISKSDSEVSMEASMRLMNYSKTEFDIKLKRQVKLLDSETIVRRLNIKPEGVKSVAYESKNVLINAGQNSWGRESGTLCIWILGMFRPSDQATVVVPFVQGEEESLGPVVTSDYFGEIPDDRLQIKDSCIFFKADGGFRGKLGVSVSRAKNVAGSYDPLNNLLTIIQYTIPSGDPAYINQLWEIQSEPFKGDVINSYNDGPVADGSQLGPFYELESSSPAAFLDPGEQIEHQHATYHFVGSKDQLNDISQEVFGVDLNAIVDVFK